MHDIDGFSNDRVLVIDDNPAIHKDFAKILTSGRSCDELNDAEGAFFGEQNDEDVHPTIDLDSAYQGEEGLEKVRQALAQGRPYALAFVDMRMPPGWDGLTTIEQLWEADPDLQIVICTAYSDKSWFDIQRRLGATDQLLILKKPFDHSEVGQLVSALSRKWSLTHQARLNQADLERIVEERTAQLQAKEETLRQQQRLKAVDSLAGGVAHEFNNLLQAIQGYTQLAMDDLPEEEPRFQDLQQVLSATERAATLTRQLLAFSRREALHRDEIDLNDAVRGVEDLLETTIGEHIELITDLTAESCPVCGDFEVLQQMLLHLCVNARDAMPDGGTLRIATEFVEIGKRYCEFHADVDPGRYVKLTVSDTGFGIGHEVKQHIFDPFFTTKEVRKGTGLGLSMVYGTVQQHGGWIYAYSEPEQGTTFKIYLPSAAKSAHKSATPAPQSARGSETVLVAEDEELVRALTVRILKQAGYTVIAVKDGQEAIEAFDAHTDEIDLALLDMVMPNKSGRAVYEHMRTIRPNMRVVFATGYDPHISQSEFAAQELVHLVQKPMDPDALLYAVRTALEGEFASDGEAPCAGSGDRGEALVKSTG